MQRQIHVFWSCSVAAAVRDKVIVVSLAAGNRRSSLAQHCGYCRRQRGFTAEYGQWCVRRQCMEAMIWGRRYLWDLSQDRSQELLDHTQTLITAFFPAIGPASTLPMTEEDQQTTLVRRGRSVDNMPRPQGDCLEP